MAILTKDQILKRIQTADLKFKPALDVFQLQAHAVDLRLGYTFLIPKKWHLTKAGREALNINYFDKNRPAYFDIIELEEGQVFDLLPGEYVLVSTLESITLPRDIMAVLYPRSSTNRKGLSVDLTGIVDSGYEGQLAIPITNNTDSQVIKLYPGERFCQLVFEQLDQAVDARQSRYHHKDIIEGFIAKHLSKDNTEINLIRKGEIKKLKNKYKIK
jgi:dCTP deaminase